MEGFFSEISISVLWFFIGLVFLLLELGLPGFVLVFFGAGAWIVCVLTLLFSISLFIQILIFLLSSLVFIFLFREKFYKLYFGKKKINDDINDSLNEFIGISAIVKEDIIPPKNGKVELHGSDWQATASVPIYKGTTVIIERKESILLFVKVK